MEQPDRTARRHGWRRALIPPAAFAMLVLAMFGDVLVTSSVVLSHPSTDLALQFLPWRQFGFDELRRGNLALWNPHIFGGTPYFAGFQSALLYPPNWLHLILPIGVAINWIIALHVFAVGYFTYFWVRYRGASAPGAVLAGAMVMFSAPFFLHIFAGHLPHLATMAWAPPILLAIDGLARTGAWRWCLLGAWAVAMQIYAGFPQHVYYTGIAAAIYAALLAMTSGRRLALLGGFVAVYLGGALLAAVQLLPGLEAQSETVRAGGLDFAFASTFALPPINLVTLVAPNFFGGLPDAYWGAGYLWEMSLFASVTGLALAIYAALYRQGNSKWILLAIIGVILVLALGRHTPLYRALYELVPKYDSFRGAAKFGYLAVLFLASLSAMGFDELLRRGVRWRRDLVPFAAAVLVLGIAIVLIHKSGTWWPQFVQDTGERAREAQELFSRPIASYSDDSFIKDTRFTASRSLIMTMGTICTIGLVLIFMLRYSRRAAYGLIALGIIEMFIFARASRATMPLSAGFPHDPSPQAQQCYTAWRAALARLPAEHRALNLVTDFANLSMRLGYDDVWGYDAIVQKRYAELLFASQGLPPQGATQYLTFTRLPPSIFRMLRCAVVLAPDPARPVVALEDPLPVAVVVPAYVVRATRDAALAHVLRADFDPAQTVVLESPPPLAISTDASPAGTVQVIAGGTDWLELRAELARPAVVLITNAYARAWRANTGDVILPANWGLQGIPLAAGSHHITLEYRPHFFVVGKWLTIGSLLALAGAVVLHLFMSRRRRFR